MSFNQDSVGLASTHVAIWQEPTRTAWVWSPRYLVSYPATFWPWQVPEARPPHLCSGGIMTQVVVGRQKARECAPTAQHSPENLVWGILCRFRKRSIQASTQGPVPHWSPLGSLLGLPLGLKSNITLTSGDLRDLRKAIGICSPPTPPPRDCSISSSGALISCPLPGIWKVSQPHCARQPGHPQPLRVILPFSWPWATFPGTPVPSLPWWWEPSQTAGKAMWWLSWGMKRKIKDELPASALWGLGRGRCAESAATGVMTQGQPSLRSQEGMSSLAFFSDSAGTDIPLGMPPPRHPCSANTYDHNYHSLGLDSFQV